MGLLESVVTFEFAKNKIPKLVASLLKIKGKREEELEKITKTFGDPKELAKFYIESNCQQFNPADDDEETHSVVTQPVLSRIQNFIDGEKRINESHLFVLADAGMGKTSLLIILKLLHLTSLWPKNYNCHLLKLGDNSLDEIAKLPTRKTVLLLGSKHTVNFMIQWFGKLILKEPSHVLFIRCPMGCHPATSTA